jgi:hypothetical protein
MYVFIVARDNIIEQCKSFIDYWKAEDYANSFISEINPDIGQLDFRKGYFYQHNGLSIGVYYGECLS